MNEIELKYESEPTMEVSVPYSDTQSASNASDIDIRNRIVKPNEIDSEFA